MIEGERFGDAQKGGEELIKKKIGEKERWIVH